MFRKAVVSFFLQLAICLAVAVVLSGIWALAKGGSYGHSLRLGLFLIGAVAFAFGALGVGGMSPSQGFIGGMGRIPGVRAGTRVSPDGTAVNATPIFLLTGAVMIVIAAVI